MENKDKTYHDSMPWSEAELEAGWRTYEALFAWIDAAEKRTVSQNFQSSTQDAKASQ